MARPSIHETFMKVAYAVSRRATCPDREVGCVLTSHDNTVLATGYNGVPSGMYHCYDTPCKARSSGGCFAIHAEANALLQCKDVKLVATCYTTTAPCIDCAKLLANTSCETIVYNEKKHHTNDVADFWVNSREGRRILHIEDTC